MRKNYRSVCFDSLIIFDPAAFKLFARAIAELVYFPFFQIEFLKMVLYPHKDADDLICVLNRPGSAGINIREIRPTVFTMMSFVIYDKIITKGRSIIFVHANGELCLKGSEFFTFQLLWRRDKKTLLFGILFISPLAGRFPRKRTISNDNIVELSLSNCYSVRHSIALFMKSLSWKIIFCCPIQQLNVINLLLHYLLQVIEMFAHYSGSQVSFVHIFILDLF